MVLVALVIAGFGIGSFFTGEEAPRYAGRSVKGWFADYRRHMFQNPDYAAKVAESLRGMGTNEMHYLFEEAFNRRKDSFYFEYLNDLVSYLPRSVPVPRLWSQEENRWAAVELISATRSGADVVLPELGPHLEGASTLWRMRALQILGSIGDPDYRVTQCLLTNLDDSSPDLCNQAARALMVLHPPAADLIPGLSTRLRADHSLQVSVRSLSILTLFESYGAQAEAAVPCLLAWLEPQDPNQPNDSEYERGVRTLLKIGFNDAGSLTFLKERFQNKTNWTLAEFVRSVKTLSRLGRNDPGTRALLDRSFAETTNWNWRCHLAAGLLAIDPAREEPWRFLTNSLATETNEFRREFVLSICQQVRTNSFSKPGFRD